MQVSNPHWSWYMWASIPNPIHRRPAHLTRRLVTSEGKDRRVVKTLETYDREGKRKKEVRRRLNLKA